ncbi:MAG: hypothetical protein JWR43_1989, partial [Phenylobacterium sp.]|nr:hypothetical protein [Phenylobacterium sp.]
TRAGDLYFAGLLLLSGLAALAYRVR